MGCDIHSFAEVKSDAKWEKVDADFEEGEPFGWRSYRMFGFLADVRNYSKVPAIAAQRGLPSDSKYLNELDSYGKGSRRQELIGDYDWHSHTWILAKELIEFDYDKEFENRRYTKVEGNSSNGAAIAEEGSGIMITYREFLGNHYFKELEILKSLGDPENVRIIMWFDN